MSKFIWKLSQSTKLLVLFIAVLFIVVFFSLAPFFHFFQNIQRPYSPNVTIYSDEMRNHAKYAAGITFVVVGLLFLAYHRKVMAMSEDEVENPEQV